LITGASKRATILLQI